MAQLPATSSDSGVGALEMPKIPTAGVLWDQDNAQQQSRPSTSARKTSSLPWERSTIRLLTTSSYHLTPWDQYLCYCSARDG